MQYDSNGYLQSCKRNENEIQREIDRLGFFVIVTLKEMTASEALAIYRKRDSVEKMNGISKGALFKQLVSNSGMNLYLGAGFSTYAYNSDRESLPLGEDINKRLIDIFSLAKTRQFNLSKSCQKIKKDNKDALNRLLKETYSVKSYDERYA